MREKPRRIYAPDENVAGFQIVTDQEFAIVGKKPGTTVLNLWFPDPRDPNNPQKDRTLSYMVVVLPDPERAALEVLAERKRLEAQVKAFEQALKVLEREIKQAFPDSAVQLSLVGEQVVVRGEARMLSRRRRSSASSRNIRPREGGRRSNPGTSTWPSSPAWATSRPRSMPSAKSWRETRTWSISCGCPGEQQVMLMVTVAEVDRTAARTIGMDFSITKGRFAFAQNTGGLNSAARRGRQGATASARQALRTSAATCPRPSTTATCSWPSRPCGP